jgi:tryptophan-rich sensory protein
MNVILRFSYSFAAVAVTALISAYFVETGMPVFYHQLNLPPLTPPDAVFAPVWSVLYMLMVWSFFRVLNGDQIGQVQNATMLFLGQLVLHALWCFLFFYSERFSEALLCLILLVATVLAMINGFRQIDKTAARLQYPYLIWILFALYLNVGVAYLNA